ncbi:YDG domain-containing protein [Methylobacterium sp. WSM2598]|uniref:YDG domain-containing protein n=1 Tax=Methylobacterium sp. WSM2598 TaxID=398261 RepID=UPI0003AB13E5|nr:YDG domain-containing protein [Methylobacterium sp. WSM2598]
MPIGSSSAQFTGLFDGRGGVIRGLTINRPALDNVGLFGVTGAGSLVRGIGLVGGSVTGKSNVGGLVGNTSRGTITQVYASGSVTGGSNIGGLVGFSSGIITQAYASGGVTGASYVGGLVGAHFGLGTITQTYASGRVTGTSYVGGLVGAANTPIIASFWDTETTGQGTSAGGMGTGLTTASARQARSYAGWSFTTDWYQAADLRPIGRWEAAPAGADGTAIITNLHQLQLMGTNLAGRYRLAADIDAGATKAAAGADASGVFGPGGFVPVGDDTAPFSGSLDGAGHVVTGLTIARPSQDAVGLIGALASGGGLTRIGLVGGSVSGSNKVGSLVGSNAGTLSQTYSTASVSGHGQRVGGLVGHNEGTISQAYATGSVSGDSTVGGLAGDNSGTISQAYATGSVTGDSTVGGLVGNINGGSIQQTYASGRVTGATGVGGLLGNGTGSVSSSFWDTETTGQAISAGGSGATGLTTAQARQARSYTGWNFMGNWFQIADLRPIGRWEAAQPGADGTALITNPHQLQLVIANLAGSYALAADLDASATAGAGAADIWGGGGFVPLGTDALRFSGAFDGRGHVISGLTINAPTSDFVGLFGAVSAAGRVARIGLAGSRITGRDKVGALAGSSDGTILQASATGRVSGGTGVGGLVGSSSGRIAQVSATGPVSGAGSVGGLVGAVTAGTLSQAYATGEVTGGADVGGLVGSSGGSIAQSYASGPVVALADPSKAGGLVGTGTGSVTSSYWDTNTTLQASSAGGGTGLTTAQARQAGSYAGWNFTTDWYQTADLRPIGRWEAAQPGADGTALITTLHQLQLVAANLAGSYALGGDLDAGATAGAGASDIWGPGGFVPIGNSSVRFTGLFDGRGGVIRGLTINRPALDNVGLFGVTGAGSLVRGIGLVGGSVTGRGNVGGLVGYSSGSITQAYATGSVTGSFNVGGLVGTNFGTIAQTSASGSVSGTNTVGGLVGTSSGSISQAYATGRVTGSVYAGGLVGYNFRTGSIAQSYASGLVVALADPSKAGGLVGTGTGSVTSSYWDTNTTLQASSAGGGTGLTTASARQAGSYAGWSFTTDWYQAGDLRPIGRWEAAPAGADGVISIATLHQLQLMGANLAGRYRLAADLDAGATTRAAAGADASEVFGPGGFVPVGDDTAPFSGSLDGAGHVVTGLTIARPSQDAVGLIGKLASGGGLTRIGLLGGSVSGGSDVGSLVGSNLGTISQAYATGSVSGASNVGSLVGSNLGTISQASATGSVSGSSQVGGLVGYNSRAGSITQAYASGSVTGDSTVGGLVGGSAGGSIQQTYASGRVTGATSVGGLLGSGTGGVSSSFWDKETTGQASSAGGGTGLTTAQARDQGSYAGWNFTTDWYQAADLRPIGRWEAVPAGADGAIPIATLHQLQLVATNLAGRYRLAADLDARATASTNAADLWGGGGFVPIGGGSTGFAGTFDGRGHVIAGLTINRPTMETVGLFSVVQSGATVSNVGLVGGSVMGGDTVGGLAGGNSGRITQAYVTASVTGGRTVGGFVGTNSGTIAQAYAAGSVTGSSAVGGFVGNNWNGLVTQAYATASVTGNTTVGGFAGSNRSTLTQVYATGRVAANNLSGGLVASSSGTVLASFWDTETTGQASSAGEGTGLTTAQARDQGSYAGWNFTRDWYQAGDLRPIGRWEAARPGADGIATVTNLHQLQLVNVNLAGSYALAGDLDAGATAGATTSDIWGSGGFVPLGNGMGPFTGRFDGRDHRIAGLTINAPSTSSAGLFGIIGPTGEVRSVGLAGGGVRAANDAGGLAGANKGFVTKVFADIDACAPSSGRAGGLVGFNDESGVLRAVYATGAVSGSDMIGGLVGSNTGLVVQAYASGPVTAALAAGGLVGTNSGTIQQAYATGNVSGGSPLDAPVGGLVGINFGAIRQTYATGRVTGSSTLGGLVGSLRSGATVTASYWDTEATGQATSAGGMGTGLTTAQMLDTPGTAGGFTATATAVGWDFTTVWARPNASAAQSSDGKTHTAELYATSGVVALDASVSMTYGDTPPTVAPTVYGAGSVFGNVVSALPSLTSSVTAQSNAGTYAIGQSGGSGISWGGRTTRFVSPGSVTVNPKTLTVSLTGSVTKTYDGSASASLTGLGFDLGRTRIGQDDVQVAGASASYADAKAGTGKAVTVSGLTLSGAAAGNYTLGTTNQVSASIGRIDKATLAVSLTGVARKTYDGRTSAGLTGLGFDLGSGRIGQDDVQVAGAGAVYADAKAGTGKSVTVSGLTLSGADAANYTLAAPTVSAAIGTIDKATLAVSLTGSARKTYDGSASAGLTGLGLNIVSGRLGQDDVQVAGASAVYADAKAGPGKSVTVSGLTLSGADAANYTLGSTSQVQGTVGTIDKATLTVSLTGVARKTYDGRASAGLTGLGFDLGSGRIGQDDVQVAGASAVYADAKAGTGKAVTVSGLTLAGVDADNYTLAAPTVSAAIGTIDKATLAVSLTGVARKTYDGRASAGLTGLGFDLGSGRLGQDDVQVAGASASYADAKAGTGKTVTVSGLTLSGADADNYTLAAPTVSAAIGTIDRATLAVSLGGAVRKVYDATVAATVAPGQLSLGGVVGQDVVQASGRAVYADAKAGTGKSVTVSGLTLSGADADNYTLAAPTASASVGTIDKAMLTVSLTGVARKTYDGSASAGLTGLGFDLGSSRLGQDDVQVAGASAVYADAKAGPGKSVTVSGLTLSGADAANYTLGSTSQVQGTVGTIDKATLAVSLTGSASKTYDGRASAGLTGLGFDLGSSRLGQDDVQVAGASASYADAKAGTGKSVTVLGLTLSGADADNYTLAAPTVSAAIGTIDRATLAVSLTGAARKTYDGSTAATLSAANYALTGLVPGDAVSVAGSAVYADAKAGTGKLVTASGLTLSGADAGNYTLGSATEISAALGTIDRATLAVALTGAVRKTYDGSALAMLGAGNFALAGLVAGDAVTVSGAGGTYDTGNAGTNKLVRASGLSLAGADAGNYVLERTSLSGGIGTIDPATLTASLRGSVSKTYDGSTAAILAAGNYALGGVVGADEVNLVWPANGVYDTKDAGTGKTVSVSGIALAGSAAGNYVLAQTSLSAAIGRILPAPLTVTAGNAAKTYDGRVYSGGNGVSYAGLVGGEDASVLGGSLTYGGPAQGARSAGSYAITPAGLTSGNYAITYAPGTLTVTKAPLTVTANGLSKTYDGQAYSGGNGVTYAGLIGGEDASVLAGSLTYGGSAQGARNAGSYAITPAGLTSGNYAITYAPGTLTVTKTPLTVTANGLSKTYDGQAFSGGNGVSYAGLVGGEEASVLGGSLTYGGSAQGARNAGTYAITPAGLTSGNYAISYAPGTLTVTKAPLTVTAGNDAKTYDGRAYSGGNGVSYAGLVGGEDASVLGGSLTYGGSAQGARNAGSYAITAAGLTSGNYGITFVEGILTVAPRPLTVAADAQSRASGQPNPVLTYAVSGLGLVGGDGLAGQLATPATPDSAPGSYPITQGTLAASPDYALTFLNGTLTVTEAVAAAGSAPPVGSPVTASTVTQVLTLNQSLTPYTPPVFQGAGLTSSQGSPLSDPRFDTPVACLSQAACYITPAAPQTGSSSAGR